MKKIKGALTCFLLATASAGYAETLPKFVANCSNPYRTETLITIPSRNQVKYVLQGSLYTSSQVSVGDAKIEFIGEPDSMYSSKYKFAFNRLTGGLFVESLYDDPRSGRTTFSMNCVKADNYTDALKEIQAIEQQKALEKKRRKDEEMAARKF